MGWQMVLWWLMDGKVITQFSTWDMLFSGHLFWFCGGGGVFDEKQVMFSWRREEENVSCL